MLRNAKNIMYNNVIRLNVIAEPTVTYKTILKIDLPETVFFIGDGNTNLLCGECGTLLADSVTESLLNGIILKCNKCQSFNDIQLNKPSKRNGL